MRCALIVPLGALALLTGCATPGPYRTMSVVFDEPAPATLGTDLDELHIAQVVARLLRDRLDLPFPQTTTIRVYVNQTTFAEGLVRDGAQIRDEAWDRARVGIAVASPQGLFLRGDLLAAMRLSERVGVIAHELAHVSQMEMGRGGPSLNTYQRRFSTDADALSHWPSVFPITSSEFVRQFRARLEQLGGTGPRGTLAAADR